MQQVEDLCDRTPKYITVKEKKTDERFWKAVDACCNKH